jgi:photosystem II stability/assembly factor-like uncharacterized protein
MVLRSRLAGLAAVASLALAGALAAQVPASLLSKLEWRSLGPSIGGRVVAVAGVPGNPTLYYMGAVGGGIWKSTDAGTQWVNISDGKLPSISPSVGAIAVAASNPSVIYAGMGESDIRTDMIPGDGMYKSTDAGRTWTYAGLRATHTISAIAIDPKNPDVVYVSSMGHVFAPDPERGVFKTTDGGKTWSKVLFVNNQTGAIDVVMDPGHPDVLYAAMWQAQRTPYSLISGGPGSGLYKTTDGGAHWTNLTRNAGLPAGIIGRIGVSLCAAQPQVVYAILQAAHGGVFRSNDGGKTWTRTYKGWPLRQRAFYYTAIYADPQNPNVVYAPNVDALWVSRDGGKTFSQLRPPHGDNHIVWINPLHTQDLLEGNDGGATVSLDGGKTWSSEHNQPTGQFYHVNLDDQFPFHVYGAQQDEGSFDGPSAAVGSINVGDWARVAYGESTYSVPEPGDPDITYGSGYYSIFLRYQLSTGQYQEVSPWPEYQEGAASNELKYRFGWTHPILFSPVNPHELLIGAQYVLASYDHGKTWQRISPDLTRNEPRTELPSGGPIMVDASGAEIYPGISALSVSPLDGEVIWAGSDDGLVHVTTNGGRTWQEVNPQGLPAHSWISSIEPSHDGRATAYLTARRYMWDDFHPYVYKTTDMGRSWQLITAGIPADTYVFDIRQDPHDANLLLLGAKNTVYASFDAGAHWQPLAANLPTAQVRDVQFNLRQGSVVIATHGRSYWALDDLAFLEQLTQSPNPSGAYLFAPQRAWLSHVYGGGGFGGPVTVGRDPAFGATVFFHVPASYDGSTPVTLTFENAHGQVVRSFRLHKAPASAPHPHPATPPTPAQIEARLTAIQPGMNRFQWDLRYPPATEVTGFQPPAAAGGLDDTVDGPTVVPGEYTAVLSFGGQTSRQPFRVSLDPRLHPAPADLAARLALQLQIHSTLDALDRKINQAIAARKRLAASGADTAAVAALNRAIDDVVQLKIQSSEGSLVFPTKLRSHLAYLAADLALSYTRPTSAEYAVYNKLAAQAAAGEKRLDAALAGAPQGQ